MIPVRLPLRERIWLADVAVIAAVLVVLTVALHYVFVARLDTEAGNVARTRATAELEGLHVAGGRITPIGSMGVPAAGDSTWVFAGDRPLERPRATAAVQRAARTMVGTEGFRDVAGSDMRLFARAVSDHGRRVGTVVAAVSTAPYEQILRVALIGSLAVAGLALLAVALASRWLVMHALRPVAEMTRQAADWSEHELERRFGLGTPHDEFTTLAATLDDLLDRVATSLRHEQLLTAELSHELRTPLTQIVAEAQFALRHRAPAGLAHDGYERILGSARHMTEILEGLLSAARAQSGPRGPTADALAAVRSAVAGHAELARTSGVELQVRDGDGPAIVRADGTLLARVLGPLLENACRHATQHVAVQVGRSDGSIRIVVADDGPGVRDGDRDLIFRPGFRAAGDGRRRSRGVRGCGVGIGRRTRLGARAPAGAGCRWRRVVAGRPRAGRAVRGGAARCVSTRRRPTARRSPSASARTITACATCYDASWATTAIGCAPPTRPPRRFARSPSTRPT